MNAWDACSGQKNAADNTTNGINPAYPNALAHAGGALECGSFWLMIV
jgi:hypothetical protein